jgi:hypothetical protein
MTVSCRRSAEAGPAGAAAGVAGRFAATGAAAPHSVQNRFSVGLSLPQAAQRQGSGDPQSPQNLQPTPTFVPQRGQFMRPSSRTRIGIGTPYGTRQRKHSRGTSSNGSPERT